MALSRVRTDTHVNLTGMPLILTVVHSQLTRECNHSGCQVPQEAVPIRRFMSASRTPAALRATTLRRPLRAVRALVHSLAFVAGLASWGLVPSQLLFSEAMESETQSQEAPADFAEIQCDPHLRPRRVNVQPANDLILDSTIAQSPALPPAPLARNGAAWERPASHLSMGNSVPLRC